MPLLPGVGGKAGKPGSRGCFVESVERTKNMTKKWKLLDSDLYDLARPAVFSWQGGNIITVFRDEYNNWLAASLNAVDIVELPEGCWHIEKVAEYLGLV